jgi:hypothetical protein
MFNLNARLIKPLKAEFLLINISKLREIFWVSNTSRSLQTTLSAAAHLAEGQFFTRRYSLFIYVLSSTASGQLQS